MVKLLIALYLLVQQPSEGHEEADSKAARTVDIQSYEVVEKPLEDKRPLTPGVPLTDDVLEYMYEISEEYDISYSLMLAMAEVESTFRDDVVSPANCVGLMQLSPNTAKYIASELGIQKFNLKDGKTSILFGAFYISYLRDQWLSKGFSEEDTYALTIISYNQGISNTNRLVKKVGFKNKYLEKVDKKKEYYEELIADANQDTGRVDSRGWTGSY